MTSFQDGAWAARQRALATFARTSPAATLDAQLAAWLEGDALERRNAIFVAGLANREGVLLRALTDPSALVRRLAVAFAASRVDGARLVAIFPTLAPSTRRGLASAVSRAGRAEVARALAALCAERREFHTARQLVEWTDEASVRRAFEEGGAGAVRWKAVARRFPALVLELLEAELAAADRDSATFGIWDEFAGAVPELVEQRPAEVLSLLERHGPRARLSPVFSSCWGRLLTAQPERVIALLELALRAGGQPLPAAVVTRAPKLPPELLGRLARAVVRDEGTFARVLEALAPSRRAQCFREATAGLDTSAHRWSDAVLAALPHALRAEEARRMRSLPASLRDPAVALSLVRWLPEAEALPLLAEELKSPKAEVRANGWALRLGVVGATRRGLQAVLKELERLRNEQDPVRQVALGELAGLPPSLFSEDDGPALLQLVEFVVTARDTSGATREALQRLAHRLMRVSAAQPGSKRFGTSLAMLLRLAEQRPHLQFPRLDEGLPRGSEVPLLATLLPWLRGEVRHEFNGNVMALATALGERAWALPELQGLLEEIVFAPSSGSRHERDRAISLWLEPAPEREVRVRKLLDWDESTVTYDAVWRHLHLRRQDWLGPFVEGRRLGGRFGSGKTGWLFPATERFEKWPRALQTTFGQTLRRVIEDRGQHLETRARMFRVLSRLTTCRVEDLEPYTQRQEVVLVEAALAALAWVDEDEAAWPVLARHLDSDRARVAMYALPRLAHGMPEARLLPALDALLARPVLKVTVRKEVVRLLGPLPGAEVTQRLRGEWQREQAHRDVKVALLHAARARLHEAAGWELLTAAARGDRELAAAVLNPPVRTVPRAYRQRYAELVVGLVDHPVPVVRQLALAELARAGGWTARAPGSAARRVSAVVLERSKEAPWPEAAKVLALAATQGEAVAHLEATVRALVGRLGEDPLVSRAGEEDLPAQARLEALGAAVCAVGAADRARTRRAREVVSGALPEVLSELWLKVALVDRQVGDGVEDLLGRAEASASTAEAFERWAGEASREGALEQWLRVAEAMVERAPWAALGVVKAAAGRFGWGPEVRAWLGRLRAVGAVQAAARAVRAP